MEKEVLEKCAKADDSLQHILRSSSKKTTLDIHISWKDGEQSIDVIDVSSTPSFKKEGITYAGLQKVIESLEQEKDSEITFTAACFLKAEKVEKQWRTTIAVFEYGDIYHIKGNSITFRTEEFLLTADEYRFVRETGLGFFDLLEEVYYPVLKVALPSIGKFMDATASYKQLPRVPLAGALLLAEKIEFQQKEFKYIFLNCDSKIKPLINVGVEKTEYGFFKKYVQSFFNTLSRKGMYHLKSWKITCIDASVLAEIVDTDPYCVKFETSNLIGKSNNVSVGVMVDDVFIPFVSRSGYKISAYDVENEIELAITEGTPFITSFNKAMENEFMEITLSEMEINSVKRIIGKKRAEGKKTVFSGNPKEVLKSFVNEYIIDGLPQKASDDITKFVTSVILKNL